MSKLVGLQFQVIYKRGAENGVVDSLSRVGNLLELHAISFVQPEWVQEVPHSYVIDVEAAQLLLELIIQSPNAKGCALKKGLITYKGDMYVGDNSLD